MVDGARTHGQALLDDLAEDLHGDPDVDRAPMFGSLALRVRGKVFAFIGREGVLVVKLDEGSVDDLVRRGEATRLEIARNPAREWAAVPVAPADDLTQWRELVNRARDFVESTT